MPNLEVPHEISMAPLTPLTREEQPKMLRDYLDNLFQLICTSDQLYTHIQALVGKAAQTSKAKGGSGLMVEAAQVLACLDAGSELHMEPVDGAQLFYVSSFSAQDKGCGLLLNKGYKGVLVQVPTSKLIEGALVARPIVTFTLASAVGYDIVIEARLAPSGYGVTVTDHHIRKVAVVHMGADVRHDPYLGMIKVKLEDLDESNPDHYGLGPVKSAQKELNSLLRAGTVDSHLRAILAHKQVGFFTLPATDLLTRMHLLYAALLPCHDVLAGLPDGASAHLYSHVHEISSVATPRAPTPGSLVTTIIHRVCLSGGLKVCCLMPHQGVELQVRVEGGRENAIFLYDNNEMRLKLETTGNPQYFNITRLR